LPPRPNPRYDLLRGFGCHTLLCQTRAEGNQTQSLRAGFALAEQFSEAAMILLADLPELNRI